MRGEANSHLMVLVSVYAATAWFLAAVPFAIAGEASSEFKVTVHLQSQAHIATPAVRSIRGSNVGANNAVLFRLPGGEPFKLRLEIIDPAVQSVEVSGLGPIISVAKEPVEMTLPESSDAIHELQLTFAVQYREGAKPRGDIPVQMTLVR